MATKTKIDRFAPAGFDVTCVIGHVEFGDGPQSAAMAAFALIDQHGAPGTYSFPNEYGSTTTVTVDAPPFETDDPDRSMHGHT